MCFIKINGVYLRIKDVDEAGLLIVDAKQEPVRVYNYYNGWFTVDINYVLGHMEEYADWHDLFKKTGNCPVKSDYTEFDSWLDTDGNFYEGEAHLLAAEHICDIIFGLDDLDNPDDYLIERGWVKLTTSTMYEIYRDDGHYNKLTQKQREAMNKWKRYHDIK